MLHICFRSLVLLVLCSALNVLGQDAPQVASYADDLPQSSLCGRVVAVSDGDTIRVLIAGNKQLRIRLAFIDAPEKGQAFGQRAKQAMSELVFGKDVELRPHTIDRYGRLVAQVIVEGQDAGLELLRQGLCWVYEKYVGEAAPDIQTSYWAAQVGAQSAKRGLWQDPDLVPPWEWRKREKERARMPQEAF